MSELTESSASPSPSNPTSLRETYVGYKTGKKILSSTEIQDQGPESYKITFEQVQNLISKSISVEPYITERNLRPEPGSTHQDPGLPSGKTTLLQVLTRSRPKKKSEKGKQRPAHYKHAEMERPWTLVSIHPHEEVPTLTPTTKLRFRPLLLFLTPEFVQGATITMGMRLKAGIGLINLSMLVKTTYNPGIGLEP
ncbi:hypothetical protein F2Q70_00030026 [Brassica cretica]|uniref:Uncharacterized protein n=1 Tax=Brassica cretica TaxID=69181 RepID=A0A8S9FVE9_BRACR|nr:hypothetical protein F2Q70_00030026 [Brassica cretica]